MADTTNDSEQRDGRADVWDLLPGYALDALDDADRRAVDHLLESDADARRAVDEYRDVVAAFAVETAPPAHLRASVLDRVQRTPQVAAPSVPAAARPAAVPTTVPAAGDDGSGTAAPSDPGPTAGHADVVDLSARRRARRWGVAATAVAAAAAIAVPTTIAVQVSAERDQLREQSEIVSEMLVDPDASILRGSVEGGGAASVLVADGDMLFRADDLPEPADGKAYQLWVVAADGSVSSAGVLSLRDGETSSLVQGVDGVGMAVSVEPESGSEQPTTDPIVVLGA
ncbi:Anti-sigma-K factor RskA [Promicromonospora umidemergens]|uniref:Regulator of SigK n=1 Tax=Promicromonospora umidemergens TaxID=629679 RepID=A0ABP8WEQ3_9MICO|nr:anti-sigma factor [Promicromonospora umidemergens]MCP2285914.1 Anti-sigma-K factor RskA [Promicromonospora umidemergens]